MQRLDLAGILFHNLQIKTVTGFNVTDLAYDSSANELIGKISGVYCFWNATTGKPKNKQTPEILSPYVTDDLDYIANEIARNGDGLISYNYDLDPDYEVMIEGEIKGNKVQSIDNLLFEVKSTQFTNFFTIDELIRAIDERLDAILNDSIEVEQTHKTLM